MREYAITQDRILQEKGTVKTCVALDGEIRGKHLIWNQEGILYQEKLENITWEELVHQLDKGETSKITAIGTYRFYVEKLSTVPKLIILGGGHVSLPVAQIGKMLEYDVIVVDDRPEFANKERFYMADQVICADYEEAFAIMPDYSNSYYVIVTPGHKKDYLSVSHVLNRNYTYIGMIGSKSKVGICKKNLLEDGFTQEKINEIHAPIGLDLGGQTPVEIAVSILGEMIQERNKDRITVMESDVKLAIQTATDSRILATIVHKTGSSPRGNSSRMLIDHEGKIQGTIGGGSVENAAIQKGKDMLKYQEIYALEEYVLSNKEGATLGMICGGNITVLFEMVY